MKYTSSWTSSMETKGSSRPARYQAGRGVGLEVLGPRPLELQRDPSTHDPDAVDGVDQRVGRFRESARRPPCSYSIMAVRSLW